jgi:hypothetical protein
MPLLIQKTNRVIRRKQRKDAKKQNPLVLQHRSIAETQTELKEKLAVEKLAPGEGTG